MKSMRNKFVCQGCGECCNGFGKGKNSSLPLFEWEVEQYKNLANQKGINMNIKPLHYFLDKKSGFVFCLNYGMFNQPCPFLQENKCSIYNDRALICKQFPLLNTPEIVKENKEAMKTNNIEASDFFLHCPNFENKKQFEENFKIGEATSVEEIKNYLKEVYGDCYDCALQSNFIKKIQSNFLQSMVEKKIIKLRKINELDLNKYRIIPFFDFLIYKGIIDNNTKEYFINSFKDKEAFKEFLKKR